MSYLGHVASMAILLPSTEGDQLCETGTYELPILSRVSDRLQYHQLRHTRAILSILDISDHGCDHVESTNQI